MAKGKYQPIFDLGEDAVLLVEREIRAGQPKLVLARKLQQAGQLKDIGQRKLARLLAGYEKDVMDRALMKRIEGTGLIAAARTAAKINVGDELMTVVAAQRQRVESAIEAASKTPGLLVDQHGKEFERYHKMLMGTAQVHMDMGLVQKASRRVTGQLTRDANNPNTVRFELTEETMAAADDVEKMLEGEFSIVPALPAPDSKAAA
jgi:hypothetical protein